MNPLLKTRKSKSKTKIKRRVLTLAMTGVLTLGLLAGCGQVQSETQTESAAQTVETTLSTTVAAQDNAAAVLAAEGFEFDEEDFVTTWDGASATKVTFSGRSINVSGRGAAVDSDSDSDSDLDGSTLRITAAGTYVLSGSLDKGQVVVNVGRDEEVHLVLNGVSLTSQGTPAIYIEDADRACITLAAGTTNALTMTSDITLTMSVTAPAETAAETETNGETGIESDAGAETSDGEPDGAIYSKGGLTLNGSGALTVNGTAKHGIVSKDDLRITGGTYVITASSDAVRGKDLIAIQDGSFTIESGADAFQSSNAEDIDKGFILIENGSFQIKTGADGFQAETALVIEDGDFDIETGGGSINAVQKSSDGGKAWGGQRPEDGTRPERGTPPTGTATGGEGVVTEEPSADSSASVAAEKAPDTEAVADEEVTGSAKGLKAGAAIVVSGGTFALDSADDGVHSNGSIEIKGGTFAIESGDDGIHADVSVVVLGGDVKVLRSFEGIEGDQVTLRGGDISIVSSDDGINTSGDIGLLVEGGFIAINAEGDGIDLNGSGAMTGGTLLIHGPTGSGNGAVDYNGDFVQSGGILIAAGSSGMAQGPGASSTELSAQLFLTSQSAGTVVRVEAEDGTVIAAFRPVKAFSSLVVASPEFVEGETYHVVVGGSSTGEEVEGLITGGVFTGGTEAVNFEAAGSVTQAIQEGASSGNVGMGGAMKRPGN